MPQVFHLAKRLMKEKKQQQDLVHLKKCPFKEKRTYEATC